MTIEEKIKNAENLFRNYYIANGSEDVKIGGRILEENGFGKDFWDMICPVLKKKGVLKSYRYEIISLGAAATYENYANPHDVRHLDARISQLERELEWPFVRYGTDPFSEGSRVEKVRDIKKQLDALNAERKAAERVHGFEINADYFKSEVKQSPETSASEIIQDEEQDDCFSYDGGISAPYAYTDLELFIMKKILLEHRQRDDGGFCAKELSFNNNSLAEICRPIHLMIEDKILYLSANTHPRPEDNGGIGIEDKRGFINWDFVEKLDKNPSEIDAIGGISFDTDGLDDLKLKATIDFGVEEFMNDRIQNPFGSAYGMDRAKLNEMLARNEQESDKKKKKWVEETFGSEESFYPYDKQRGIIIDELANGNEGEAVISLNDFRDKQVDVLKTLLALEKENLLRIKELKSNAMYDENGFIGLWATKDNPTAKVSILKLPTNVAAKPTANFGSGTPFTSEKKGMGYFHLSKHGAKIEIGGVGTRPFRLLRRLCNPFGPSQKVAEVFESIRRPQDDRDSQLREYNPEKISRMVHIIQTSCIKEYQKMPKLKGKIKIRFNPAKTEIWFEILT